ncbi:hypothetical protein ACUNV4_01740 [Granulosicoccus sp. 3-233]|uniref:hypothetical protein n=1 Tax=Granulosicoccus sp. 3-233 TaxID=3417969 RepID=UPI003D332A2B
MKHHTRLTVHAFFILCSLCLCFALFNGPVRAAEITPRITLLGSLEPVYLGDSVIIELEAVGLDDPVDITPLLQETELLRETMGTRITVVSGQVVEMKSRRMELLPRREGRLILGPLQAGSVTDFVQSNIITIDVQTPTESQWQADADDLQINVSLRTADGSVQLGAHDDDPVPVPTIQALVGQHIIADIELRHRHPIADERISLPDFDGFDVLEQFVERRTIDTLADQTSWRLTAWRYHLFAQRSGRQVLDPVGWTGTVIRSRTQRADFDRQSSPYTLQIQPAVDSSHWWLPASSVNLDDSWSSDPRELTAGDEILRTITLDARDVLANHLPDIMPPESRALTTTLIGQSRSQRLVGEHIVATAVFDYRMIAQSPIPVFLDTVRVPWYDTTSHSARQAIIPARRINVGLPDRADLLASLALEGNVLDRLLLRLEGSGIARSLPWHVLLLLTGIVTVWIWVREINVFRREQGQKKQGLQSTVLPEL